MRKAWKVAGELSAFALALVVVVAACAPQTVQVSEAPDTPFKLATFEADGGASVGLVLGDQVLDVGEASDHLVTEAGLDPVALPNEMRLLIEAYDVVSSRLYQIANYFSDGADATLPFVHDLASVSIMAPIKYPWNVFAAAANYRTHAEGMGTVGAAQVVPGRDAPVMFAKSPRSGIIDPGEPYYIPPGRDRIDWEGEMAIIIGEPAYLVSADDAHDYVFGYSIMYDVSDRGGRTREVRMFPGPNWFDGKSTNRGAPFGPFIVPKEFLPNHENLRLVTRVNGEVMQDQTTADLIWNEAHLISYTTSILTLYPGDVIATGTPSGTGAERGVFLQPGDVVEIELEGVGTLTTPIEAWDPAR